MKVPQNYTKIRLLTFKQQRLVKKHFGDIILLLLGLYLLELTKHQMLLGNTTDAHMFVMSMVCLHNHFNLTIYVIYTTELNKPHG